MKKQNKKQKSLQEGYFPKARSAQTIGQVFIFILGAVVFILILLYGYRGISTFLDRSETVALIDMEQSIKSGVESIRLDYGSTKRLELRTPSKFREICFVTETNPVPTQLRASHPLLAEAASGGTQNVFLQPLAKQAVYIEGLTTELGCHCSNITAGKVTLKLESLGNKTRVSDWERGAQC